MTPLRQKMIEDMQLRGLSERTQRSYLTAVKGLAAYYRKSPDQVSEAELRDYFLYLKNEKQRSASTITQTLCALKFLYQRTLKQPWPLLELVKPQRERKLPVVLSRNEVKRLLGAIRRPHYRVCLSTIYSCGLRVGEGVGLPVRAIDSSRMTVHIQQGKGRKDRYVPLPAYTLAQLRAFWLSHRHPHWLFPGRQVERNNKPLSVAGLRKAFRAALKEGGIKKAATIHTLRHSYATHLVEAGVQLHLLQRYLGHASLTSTLIYVHLAAQRQPDAVSRINTLMAELP
jgi:site-specific recombinase XerD